VLQEGAREALEPIAALIIPPFDNLLDIQSVVSSAIRENINRCLDETISSIHPSLAKAIAELNAQEPTERQVWDTVPPEKEEEEDAVSPPSSPKVDRAEN